jgi:hypothetical protein
MESRREVKRKKRRKREAMDLRKRGLDWSLIFDFDLCFMMVGVG